MQNSYTPGAHDNRPWGEWTVLDAGPGFAVKRIRVAPDGMLSLQRHQYRAEFWTIVAGQAQVTVGARVFTVGVGESVHIPLHEWHRIANPGAVDMVFIEVQTGEKLDEADIERSEDRYGRT